jgi:hypothetical protein
MKRFFLLLLFTAFGYTFLFSQNETAKAKDTVSCRLNLMGLNYNLPRNYYQRAYTNLQYLIKNCPGYSEKIYIDGQTVFDSLIVFESNPLRKRVLVDSLMIFYDLRIRYYGNEGFVLGRKGVRLYLLDPFKAEEAYRILARSVELEGYKSRPPVLIHYMSSIVELVQKGKADIATAYQAYDKIGQLFSEVRQFNPEEEYTYKKVYQTAGDYLNRLTHCDMLEKEYDAAYQADSNNSETLRNMLESMMSKRCNSSQVIYKIAKRLFTLNKSPEAALDYADFLISMGKIKPAYQHLSEAIKSTNKATAVKAYILFGNLHRYYDAMPRGRTMLLKALELDSTAGQAYIVMADLYLSTISECGLNDLDRASVYWAASDKLELAVKADPSLKEEASKILEECKKNYPTLKFLSMNGLKPGDVYDIKDCWIMEKTKVRAKD